MTSSERAAPTVGQRVRTSLREMPVLLLVALVLAFLLRTFVVQVFYIPSGSMEPTLAVDDRILVDKVTTRFRAPERGEIVVFELDTVDAAPRPAWTSALQAIGRFVGVVPADARDYVKRVIGLSGDVVSVDAGVVSVNGVPIDEPYVAHGDSGTFEPVEVPEGMLYVLGDNRPNSSDSRYPALGMIRVEDVLGRAVATIWPLAHAAGSEAAAHPAIPPR